MTKKFGLLVALELYKNVSILDFRMLNFRKKSYLVLVFLIDFFFFTCQSLCFFILF